MNEIKVIELFAGVGGFRQGLKEASGKFNVVWSNQWEPNTKSQVASDIYVNRFGVKNHSNEDIASVPTSNIPDHNLLVGGFPCQDYSVARTLNQAAGIKGKKGVLWWQIYRILEEKKHRPEFLLLENVDRLLKSPAKQRGRDFAIMLASLSDLGYIVEWRVLNAADYGMPQRRRRVFLLGYHKKSDIYKQIMKENDLVKWILRTGLMAETFKINGYADKNYDFELKGDLEQISKNFNLKKDSKSPFENCGIVVDRKVNTLKTTPNYKGPFKTLKDIVLTNGNVPKEYYIDEVSLPKWNYFKKAKKEVRQNKTNGFEYNYAEGSMVFPDPLDKPARTIVTGEGGSSPSRFKHVIKSSGRLRRLTPIELERLNMFPDDHTAGVSDIKRAFLMGNALVVGIVKLLGETIAKRALGEVNFEQIKEEIGY